MEMQHAHPHARKRAGRGATPVEGGWRPAGRRAEADRGGGGWSAGDCAGGRFACVTRDQLGA